MRLLVRLLMALRVVWHFWQLGLSAWSTPNTAVAGAPISAADYNTYVRDDLSYLHSQRPRDWVCYEGSSNYTSSSTSFATVDTTNLRLEATVSSGRVRVEYSLTVRHSDTASGSGSDLGGTMAFDVLMNGSTRAGGTNGVAKFLQGNNGTTQRYITIVAEFTTGVVAGANYFDLVAKTSGATLTIFNNAFPITGRAVEF